MSPRKYMKKVMASNAPKYSCPAQALAVKANRVVAVLNEIEQRGIANKELPLDEMTGVEFNDRLDAIQVEASYCEPRSPDGAAFLLMVAGATYDVLISSTFASDRERERLERLTARLIEAGWEYLLSESAKSGASGKSAWMDWLDAAQYFGGVPIRRVAKKAA